MTAHLHSTLVDGCYRCELGKDEEAHIVAERREVAAEALYRYHGESEFGPWATAGPELKADLLAEVDVVISALAEAGWL